MFHKAVFGTNLLILLACLTQACMAPAVYRGRVTHVADGDSFELTMADSPSPIKVRLYGIDAPEKGQSHANAARSFARRLLEGHDVELQLIETDDFGRLVAWVRLADGRLANHEILANGHAWWFRKYAPADRELASLEAEAKGRKLGLWADPNPKPPWQFRYEKRRR